MQWLEQEVKKKLSIKIIFGIQNILLNLEKIKCCEAVFKNCVSDKNKVFCPLETADMLDQNGCCNVFHSILGM